MRAPLIRLVMESDRVAEQGTIALMDQLRPLAAHEGRMFSAAWQGELAPARANRRWIDWPNWDAGITASLLWPVSALRSYWISGFSSLREGIKQIARPLIASRTVVHHSRHEVWTPMLASRDKKQHDRDECSPHV